MINDQYSGYIMPRIDDYKKARELSKKELSEKDPELVTDLSGAVYNMDSPGNSSFSIRFLNRDILITWPELEFSYKGTDEEIPIQQQILILHYLNGAVSSKGPAAKGAWLSFQEVPDGMFYMGPFMKRAKDPLLGTFGDRPELMVELASKAYDATPLDYGDFSVKVTALPLAPLALVLWKGDDEFPPEGNILFDRNISKILSAEDMAWLAGMVVYPLIGMARSA